jgi:hypothetical protein
MLIGPAPGLYPRDPGSVARARAGMPLPHFCPSRFTVSADGGGANRDSVDALHLPGWLPVNATDVADVSFGSQADVLTSPTPGLLCT